MKDSGKFRIGTSGWQYDHWKGVFYPQDLPKDKWFQYYTKYFDTVEVNNSFYHLPSEKTFDSWHDQAPRGFLYTLKFSRYGTQMKKLKDPEATIGNFLERAKRLKTYLGPILVQLPPRWKCNVSRLESFLDAPCSNIRWALEFRDPSWLNQEVYQVLRDHNAALVIHDLIENHPYKITADWVYLRFHGIDYTHNYSSQALSSAATKIRGHLKDGLDVYAYFNNDAQGFAVQNSLNLLHLLEESDS
jgi:uncharacterized protein YecE (DUF72 family)